MTEKRGVSRFVSSPEPQLPAERYGAAKAYGGASHRTELQGNRRHLVKPKCEEDAASDHRGSKGGNEFQTLRRQKTTPLKEGSTPVQGTIGILNRHQHIEGTSKSD